MATGIGMTPGISFGPGAHLGSFADDFYIAGLDQLLDRFPLTVEGCDLSFLARPDAKRLASREPDL